jgi:hypothetical protein
MLPQTHMVPAPMPDIRTMADGGAVRGAMDIPDGGLASFLSSNIDEMDDSRLAFGPQAGINSMRETAERMAQMGRGGDNYIVHASEREMIVPREVVENNPELRAAIMQGIAAEGADPNAYIVGSDANSINPMTGQREFFLKRIARGVKRVVKGVVNVVKKVAPIVLPIVGSMVLGPVVGTALGSAAATAIRGGSAKDILKSAALGGISGGVFAGVSGAIQGVQSGIGALQGAKAAIGAAVSPSNVFGNLGSRIAERGIFSAYQGPDFSALAQARGVSGDAPLMDRVLGRAPTAPAAGAEGAVAGPGAAQPTLFERAQNALGLGGRSAASPTAQVEAFQALKAANPGVPDSVIQQALASSQPSLLQRFGPTLAGGLALGAATGAFNAPEQEFASIPGFDVSDTGERRFEERPEDYLVFPSSPAIQPVLPSDVLVAPPTIPTQVDYSQILGTPTGGAPPIQSNFNMPQFQQPAPLPPMETLMAQGSLPQASDQSFGVDRFGNPIQSVYGMQPLQFAARGGEMQNFPRRMGAISGPGTGTSDDVPAMLSDGEFVMTARAVRGAGNGDRREGVKRMYDMMRKFEGGGAAA